MPTYEGATKTPAAAPERFTSPHEELAYLRERVREKEREVHEAPQSGFEHERIVKREVREYAATPAKDVLDDTYKLAEHDILREQLRLEPEEHDVQMEELLAMIAERGIKNTLAVVRSMGSAHLEDDLHRVLVRYVAEGLPTKGVSQSSETWRALHMTLYEVALSHTSGDDTKDPQALTRMLGVMEQFYAGILHMVGSGSLKEQEVFTLEIANQQGSDEAIMYVAVPITRKDMFEKHVTATFPHAQLAEVRGDYNIFHYGGAHTGAYGALQKEALYPLKNYNDFTHDPLNIILSAFSQLKTHGEGAAIQFVIGDSGDMYNKQGKATLDYLRKGEKVRTALKYGTRPFAEVSDMFKKEFVNALFSKSSKNETEKQKPVDDVSLELITKKVNSKIVPTTVRIIASADDASRAASILDNIRSTFNQFSDAQGNALVFKETRGTALRTLLHEFSFRSLSMAHIVPLSLAELATMFHLSGEGINSSRELKQSHAKSVAAPIGVGGKSTVAVVGETAAAAQPAAAGGVVLGKNMFGGRETLVTFKAEDRMRHFYEIGQTGTGKTNLMKNMIIQDIRNGEGCCYIDPHGSDIVDVLAAVPEERFDDVIYFDPAHMETPMGLNMMEYNPAHPEQKTFVVNEIFSIFEKLFLAKSPESLGPMFEQYFRNAAMLVLEGMEEGTATMADIPRVLADSAFRQRCLARSRNMLVNQFWTDIAEAAGGDASLENIVPYITAKTDIFLSNDIMRPILAQPKSAFNFREIMDSKKILLVNLSKGRLGDLNSELLGLIVVGKFLQAALSRVDAHSGEKPADFYLYIDEFQNFTTPSIATILSEARKYRLSLNVAHQFVAQLNDNIRDAVFGNVGTKCAFRVGIEDAEFLEKQFAPEFSASDIAGLDNFNAYISLLVDGKPAQPFNMVTLPPEPVDFQKVEYLKQLSYHTYGRDREQVEAEIQAKYQKAPIQNTTL